MLMSFHMIWFHVTTLHVIFVSCPFSCHWYDFMFLFTPCFCIACNPLHQLIYFSLMSLFFLVSLTFSCYVISYSLTSLIEFTSLMSNNFAWYHFIRLVSFFICMFIRFTHSLHVMSSNALSLHPSFIEFNFISISFMGPVRIVRTPTLERASVPRYCKRLGLQPDHWHFVSLHSISCDIMSFHSIY